MLRCFAFAALTVFPETAFSGEIWKELELWTIRVITQDVSRCYASKTLQDGSELQIGAEPTLDGGYFAIYNSAWTHIKNGQEGTVEFDFARSRFGGDAVRKIENGVPGGYVYFTFLLLSKSLRDSRPSQ